MYPNVVLYTKFVHTCSAKQGYCEHAYSEVTFIPLNFLTCCKLD